MKRILIITLALFITGCSLFQTPEPVVVTETKVIKREIPLKSRPESINMKNVTWYVVTPETYDEFKAKFEKDTGEIVYYAFSVQDYERMSINLAEMIRYIEQQKQIIVYYEKAIKEE